MSATELAITAIANALSERTRLSGDAIVTWFKSDVAPILAETFSKRLNVTVQDKKVLGVIAAYESNMKLLAGNSKMEDKQLDNLLKAVGMAVPSEMQDKLFKRIEVLCTPVVIDMMDLV
jgi:hypothetical protein